MTLPVIQQPIFETTLPSTKELITFRAFTVKEEKILLRSIATNDPKEMNMAMKQIISNCLINPEKDILKRVTAFDVEWLLAQFRCHSIEPKITKEYLCKNEVEGIVCDNKIILQIDLEKDMPKNMEEPNDYSFNPDIVLSDSLTITMKQAPMFEVIEKNTLIETPEDEIEETFNLIYESTEAVYINQKKYSIKDMEKQEFISLLEQLTESQFEKIEKFISNVPYFEVKKKEKCSKCGFEHEFVFGDPSSFF